MTTTYLGTSTGVRLRYAEPEGRLELTAKTTSGAARAWAGPRRRDLADDGRRLRWTASCAQGLGWQASRVDVHAGGTPRCCHRRAVADLMIDAYWSSVARDAADGQSVCSHAGGGTRVGERVADPRVHLWSDPAMPGLEAMPFVAATGRPGRRACSTTGCR